MIRVPLCLWLLRQTAILTKLRIDVELSSYPIAPLLFHWRYLCIPQSRIKVPTIRLELWRHPVKVVADNVIIISLFTGFRWCGTRAVRCSAWTIATVKLGAITRELELSIGAF